MYHSYNLAEFVKPRLVEVISVQKAERFTHRIVSHDIRGHSAVGKAKRHRFFRCLEVLNPPAEVLNSLLDHIFFKIENHAASEVRADGSPSHFVKLVMYCVGRRIWMTELLNMPPVFVELLEIVNFVIVVRVVDMDLIGINSNNWT